MKIPLMYGSIAAIVDALVWYGLYFAGFQDTPAKLQSSQWIATCLGIVVSVICYALAMRDKRAQSPSDQPWTYGSAFVTGLLTALVAAFLGAILYYVYATIVNPQWSDLMYQAQVAKMEAKGMSSAQIDQASGMMRKFMTPTITTFFRLLGGIVWGTILALIVAIFFRKREFAADVPPPVA